VSRRGSTADEVLVRRIFQEHGAALVAYATRLTGDRTRAEAVVQEVLMRVWRDPGALAVDKGVARASLLTITRDLAAGTDRGAAVDSMAVLSAVKALPSEQRDVLEALYFQGRDVAETAASLGVPAGAVKARSYHALRQLRETVR
jgi:RNA polymerase sigma-70 factor (ECF subfamily)